MELIQKISKIPLFEGLPPDQLKDLAGIALEKSFERGRVVFSEGQSAHGFFIVTSGKVKIFKISPDGKEQILHLFGPGEPFGEVPVFEGRPFPAHATALADSRFIFFPRTAFVELIKNNPSLALNMLAVLSRRLRRFTVLVDDLSLKEVPGRLAAHLLYLSNQQQGKDDIELEMPKGQLAGLLGTIPETLSRILAKMSKQELIAIDGRSITIKDRQGLIDLAEGSTRL
ncbi:Crp/Fnr family transcriptional regulator [Desulfomonile tiedjei]|uniref:cAMP-binding protein n=1 Tax=Desulfomonile tiedjei (strain ATCC 49306 / DSM 6799 / DCB-1) TaxID=706587 RepID=I4C6K6_DESTA|nr:Crp/Fnr family transcriptional regulator [Desulfomonile tiedjei]AFM25197.1 cAMP-binding protein [Desulfomonile tiedjei DSM 6799]